MIVKPPKGAYLNRGHPLSRGLVGCWPFNEGAGNVVRDASGNGQHLAAGATAGWALGYGGPCVTFTGATTSVLTSRTSTIWNTGNVFSCLVWVRVDSVDATNDYIIGSGPGWGFYFRINANTGTINTALATTGKTFAECHSAYAGPTIGVWTQYVMTYESGSAKLYRQGIQSGNTVTSFTGNLTGESGKFSIGDLADNGSLIGAVSGAAYYSRALSPAEIRSLYLDPYQMFRRSPIELWTAASGGATPPAFKPNWIPRRRQVIGAGVI